MLVLLVNLHVKPDKVEDFVRAIMENARSAVRDEPGCLRFDVSQDLEDPSRIYLYEVYEDDEALEAHRQAPHFLKWRDTVQDWHAEPAVRHLAKNIIPSDEEW